MKNKVWAIKVNNRYYYNSDTRKMAMKKYIDDQSLPLCYEDHKMNWDYAKKNVVKITIKEGWR